MPIPVLLFGAFALLLINMSNMKSVNHVEFCLEILTLYNCQIVRRNINIVVLFRGIIPYNALSFYIIARTGVLKNNTNVFFSVSGNGAPNSTCQSIANYFHRWDPSNQILS